MYAPRRKKSSAATVILAVVLILLVAGVGGGYYAIEVRPKKYLKDWSRSFGYPNYLVRTQSWADREKAYINIRQGCLPTNRACAASNPAKSVANWLAVGGGTLSEREVGECFRDGCQHVFYRDGHKGVANIHRYSAPLYELNVDVYLYW